MTTLTTFQPLLDRCEEYDLLKADNVVPSHHLYFDTDGGLAIDTGNWHQKFDLEDNALNQLAGRLGSTFWENNKRTIPQGYYRHLYRRFPAQFANLSNALLDQTEGHLLIRTYDDKVRAVLTDQYAKLDNREIVEMAAEVFTGLDVEIVESGQYYSRNDGILRDEMSMRIVVKNVLPPGEPGGYGLGVLIRNGETGGAASEVRPLVMRTTCMNSIVFKTGENGESLGLRLTHRGQRAAKVTLMAAAIAEALPMAEEGLSRFLATKRRLIDLGAVIAGLGTEQGWSEEMRLSVGVGSEGHESVYGLINGLTFCANQVDTSMEERLSMETLAALFVQRPEMAQVR